MRKVILGLFYIFLTVTVVFSQAVIKGKILDAKIKQPIPYANIVLKGTHCGTVSNEQGNFTFVMPTSKSVSSDTLSISCIGYKTQNILIKKSNKNIEIQLKPMPAKLSEVEIKEKNKPTTVKEILKKTWENYLDNTTIDTLLKTYYIRDYAKHDKFFFSEKSVSSTLDNNFRTDTMWAYNLKSSCGYLKSYKKELLSVGYWIANLTALNNGKYITKYICKHPHKSFIDTVYMKDDHLIFVVVYTNKLDKISYHNSTQSIKLDPTWASLHYSAFEPFITKNIELSKVYIDKTDNYKVLKVVLLEVKNAISTFDITSLSFSNYGNKMVLSHEQEYYRQTNKDTSFYVDRYSEMLLTDIKVKPDTMPVPNGDYQDIVDKLHNGYPFKSKCLPNTTFGNWNFYNTIENDSLDIKVDADLQKLEEEYRKK